MRPLLFSLSMGILCIASSCKQEQKETTPFNESVCETVQKREKPAGITDLTDTGESCTLSLCEDEFLKDGIRIDEGYGNYWKETFNPEVQQLTTNGFFTFSHQASKTKEGAQWQGFTISTIYYPETPANKGTVEKKWGTMANGGLINPYIPFPLEPKVPMIEGVTGAPFILAQWTSGNETSLEDINKKFKEKDFSCWTKLGQKEEYLPRGLYISLPSLAFPDLTGKTLVIRGVDKAGKFSRATIKTPLIAPTGEDSKSKWRWIDLSRLGKSQYLVFQVGSVQEEPGVTFAMTYSFCLDALTVDK